MEGVKQGSDRGADRKICVDCESEGECKRAGTKGAERGRVSGSASESASDSDSSGSGSGSDSESESERESESESDMERERLFHDTESESDSFSPSSDSVNDSCCDDDDWDPRRCCLPTQSCCVSPPVSSQGHGVCREDIRYGHDALVALVLGDPLPERELPVGGISQTLRKRILEEEAAHDAPHVRAALDKLYDLDFIKSVELETGDGGDGVQTSVRPGRSQGR